MSMLFPSLDPNEQFRGRRAAIRRRRRRRRALAFGVVLFAVLAVAGGMTLATKSSRGEKTVQAPVVEAPRLQTKIVVPRALPVEIRGIHVTGPLASIPGKLEEYVALTRAGLNTIELDVKDEGGIVNFEATSVPLAVRAGAVRGYFEPRRVARLAHRNRIHLIGRIVVFQDPMLVDERPDLAIRHRDGSVWKTHAGLAWLNPYDRRVWSYAVSLAEEVARAGFDEIMFDYVRFPSDGDVAGAVYPARTTQPRGRLIADFMSYAKRRLAPYGVRISTALFGLSATRDMRIGQVPRWISEHVDTISPMAYPALYGGGELGIREPSRQPGETVFRTLADFRDQVGARALLVPWIQDWNYAPEFVRAQVEAARLQGAKGFLLWNAEGRYTASALAPARP
jgi:hypothetical protein